jgi:ribosomal protein S18 acetylase RimI-like enzyme
MEVAVRFAAADDASAIADLCLEVAREVVEREPTVRQAPDRRSVEARYDARVGEPDRAVFVAFVDGSMVGFADAALVRSIDEASYHAPGLDVYVEDLIVTSALRRQGIARSLLLAVEEWAIDAGARMVTLDTHVSNRAARSLYGATGYREVGIILAKEL